MQSSRLVLFAALALAACTPVLRSAPPAAVGSSLTAAEKAAIGKKIWQNESAGKVDGLTAWNGGEEFPSLGIGHFIWYPAGYQGPFEESWPKFIAYAREHGVQPPAIALSKGSPWKNQAAFKAAFNSAEMKELRQWLASTVTLQTDFIIARSRAALPKVAAAAPASDRARVQANYQKVASTPQGTYALIDYVNFKGDGTSVSEKYNGLGWGLLQSLAGMKDVPSGPAAATEFAASAKRMLARRVANAPAARNEDKWLQGWSNRCDTYAKPL